MRAVRRRCARALQLRACSGAPPTPHAHLPSEVEYWKTTAHYYKERLQAQQQFMGQCARMSAGFDDAARGWEYWQLDAYDNSVTYEEFFEKNSKGQRACVIRGLDVCPSTWGQLEFWREEIRDGGDFDVTPTMFNPSVSRGLETADADVPFGEYLAKFASRMQYAPTTPDDWSALSMNVPPEARLRSVEVPLPASAPWVLGDYNVPKYFSQDLLQYALQCRQLRAAQVDDREVLERTNPRAAMPALYLDDTLHLINGGPTLRINPRGTQCALHTTGQSYHTWIHVASGAIEFRIFSSQYAPALYDDSECTYLLDAFEPDFHAFPSAIMAYPWKVTLRAGDTLFIPADFPVQWRALEDSISTAMHFVDWGNVETATFEAHRFAECGDPLSRALCTSFNMRFLSAPQCQQTLEPIDTPYAAYLTWRNDSVVDVPK